MKQKNLVNLSLILFFGIALIVGRNLWNSYQSNKPNQYQNTLKNISKDKINYLQISKADQSLMFTNDNNAWKVATQSADTKKVTELINSFFPTSSPLLISEASDQLDILEVTEEKGTKIDLKTNDNKEITLYIGKVSGLSTPILIKDQQQVYALRGIPTILLTENNWYNLNIVDVESENINKFQFIEGKTNLTLEKRDGNWYLNDTQVKKEAVDTYLMKLNPFKATQIAFDRKKQEYAKIKTSFSLLLTDNANQEYKLEFYSGKNDWLVKRLIPNENTYSISKTNATDLKITKDQFTPQS